MARKTNDLDKSSKNEIDSKKIHTKLETKKIPASVKTIIKTAEKNIKKFIVFARSICFYDLHNLQKQKKIR